MKLKADKIMDSIIGMALGEQKDAKAADRLRAAQTALDRIGIIAKTGTSVNVELNIHTALSTGELLERAEKLTEELRIIDVDPEEPKQLEADAGGSDAEET